MGIVQRLSGRLPGENDKHWVGTWATSSNRFGFKRVPVRPPPQFRAQTTLRQIVHVSLGGSEVRVELSNFGGDDPLVIGATHIALRSSGAGIVPETDRALTFNGESSVVIPPHQPMLSDPVHLDVPALSDLAVSIYLPDSTEGWTVQGGARKTNYISPASGNYTDATAMPIASTDIRSFFMTGVHVAAPEHAAAIVAFGDSWVTSNGATLDLDRGFPEVLASRLHAEAGFQHLAVLNEGIGGNRLLYDKLGLSALSRFDLDVLAQPGVKYVIVALGSNDIALPGWSDIPLSETVTAEELIAGYRQLIARAHARGVKIFGTTMGPNDPAYRDELEAKRQACNDWIRNSGEFDAVIDFDEVLRDPSDPARYLPAYLIGTSLRDHPNDAGNRAMAEAIPLRLFR